MPPPVAAGVAPEGRGNEARAHLRYVRAQFIQVPRRLLGRVTLSFLFIYGLLRIRRAARLSMNHNKIIHKLAGLAENLDFAAQKNGHDFRYYPKRITYTYSLPKLRWCPR